MKTQSKDPQTMEPRLAALEQRIAELEKQVKALTPIAQIVKAIEPPANVKEAHTILSAIPKATLEALKVVSIGFDPKAVWFQLRRQNGTRISVKKAQGDLRVRVRDEHGTLLKEATTSFNGLGAALKALV